MIGINKNIFIFNVESKFARLYRVYPRYRIAENTLRWYFVISCSQNFSIILQTDLHLTQTEWFHGSSYIPAYNVILMCASRLTK